MAVVPFVGVTVVKKVKDSFALDALCFSKVFIHGFAPRWLVRNISVSMRSKLVKPLSKISLWHASYMGKGEREFELDEADDRDGWRWVMRWEGTTAYEALNEALSAAPHV